MTSLDSQNGSGNGEARCVSDVLSVALEKGGGEESEKKTNILPHAALQ